MFLATFTFAQQKVVVVKKDSISKTIEPTKDYDAFIYKCYDDSSKKELYIDFIVPGQVTFFVNKTFITYDIESYKIASKDSTWAKDSISFYLRQGMPIDSIIMNSDGTKVFIYSIEKQNCERVNMVRIIHSLSGIHETMYLRKKRFYSDFKYGEKNSPDYIKYDKK